MTNNLVPGGFGVYLGSGKSTDKTHPVTSQNSGKLAAWLQSDVTWFCFSIGSKSHGFDTIQHGFGVEPLCSACFQNHVHSTWLHCTWTQFCGTWTQFCCTWTGLHCTWTCLRFHQDEPGLSLIHI